MGLFGKIFGKVDCTEVILHSGMTIAAETERVYRAHLGDNLPTGVGLLKARLLSSTFAAAVFIIGRCGKSDAENYSFMQACSGIAMKPFNQPGGNPTVSRSKAEAFAPSFMSKALRLIQAELSEGPSNTDVKTEAFQKLVNMYHHCLAESVGEERYKTSMKGDFEAYAETVIWTHFHFLSDMLKAVKRL
ncbi:MAG: hypothetical protein WCD79_12840 [Chthoniobacteraceae bacterium]